MEIPFYVYIPLLIFIGIGLFIIYLSEFSMFGLCAFIGYLGIGATSLMFFDSRSLTLINLLFFLWATMIAAIFTWFVLKIR